MLMQTLRIELNFVQTEKKKSACNWVGCSVHLGQQHTPNHIFLFLLAQFFFNLNIFSLEYITVSSNHPYFGGIFYVFFLYRGSMGAHDTFSYIDFYYTFHWLHNWIWKHALNFRSELFSIFCTISGSKYK